MKIRDVQISNFRALESVSIPLNQFSVLIGENDVGKTSFLYALENFFCAKKLTDESDWFNRDTAKDIRIVLTFDDFDDIENELGEIMREDGSIIVSKIFKHGKAVEVGATLDDNSSVNISKSILTKWFGSESFHFIPVRRDLKVQFSMNKTALLGKTLRARMKSTLEEGGELDSLRELQNTLKTSLDEPREDLESFLREQMHNDTFNIGFEDFIIDPIEGITFDVSLSDDRVEKIVIENRGAGTQNNLIIALFRLIAKFKLYGSFIFAMEEPENSLHPKAQRQLASVIQEISSGSQVIVTSHSPVFIDRSKYENNIILTRTPAGNTVAKTFDMSQLSEIRTDLGIRASDALLKGGGNCAVLVEGKTEENGFPIWMEMHGMSEFNLGIAIINMGGSDKIKVGNIARLLSAYDIPCVIVLDSDAKDTAAEMHRLKDTSLGNIKEVFCLSKGTIEDYYPLEIIVEVINRELSLGTIFKIDDFDSELTGSQRLKNITKVMFEKDSGSSLEYLKSTIGISGTKLMKEKGMPLDKEIVQIFEKIKSVVNSA